MKTITKITAAALLAVAAASPALAKHKRPVHHPTAMTQPQQDEADQARAYVPPTEADTYSKCCTAADY